MQWSDGWGPGEGVLLDGFVVSVEGGVEEDGGDTAGNVADIWHEVGSKPGPFQTKGSGTRTSMLGLKSSPPLLVSLYLNRHRISI